VSKYEFFETMVSMLGVFGGGFLVTISVAIWELHKIRMSLQRVLIRSGDEDNKSKTSETEANVSREDNPGTTEEISG